LKDGCRGASAAVATNYESDIMGKQKTFNQCFPTARLETLPLQKREKGGCFLNHAVKNLANVKLLHAYGSMLSVGGDRGLMLCQPHNKITGSWRIFYQISIVLHMISLNFGTWTKGT